MKKEANQINNWAKDTKRIKKGIKVPSDFIYSSDNNSDWMSVEELNDWINANQKFIDNIIIAIVRCNDNL